MRRQFICVSLSIFLVACSAQKPAAWQDLDDYEIIRSKLSHILNNDVILHIGVIEVPTRLLGLEGDRLIVQRGFLTAEIPIYAISSMTVPSYAMSVARIGTGMALAGISGWVVSDAIGSRIIRNASDTRSQRRQALFNIGTTIAFLFGGAFLSANTADKVIVVNERIEPLVLDDVLGYEITQEERRKYELFEDLQIGMGESLARIYLVKFSPTEYLMLYDCLRSRELTGTPHMITYWQTVDRSYLVAQQDKIYAYKKRQRRRTEFKLFHR